MARPREPIDLIVAKNKSHRTKEEIEERKNSEIRAPNDKIEAPDFLSDKEKEEFYKIANQLSELGIMSNLDNDILARYIRARTEYIRITKELSAISFSNSNCDEKSEDIYCYDKVQKIQTRLFKQCNECARELGLTISSRCKLVVPKKEEPIKHNKFAKFI